MANPKKGNKKEQESIQKPPAADPHHHKFMWNWRMLVLGILLNIATLSLVVYTVSLLKDYRECTQGYSNLLQESIRTVDEEDGDALEEDESEWIDEETDSSVNTNSSVNVNSLNANTTTSNANTNQSTNSSNVNVSVIE